VAHRKKRAKIAVFIDLSCPGEIAKRVKELRMPDRRGFRHGKGNPHTKPGWVGFELPELDGGVVARVCTFVEDRVVDRDLSL
jgi:hypothetical protein